DIRKLGTDLAIDADLSPELFVEQLAASGYVREDPILNFGQFSLRGGIVDVWSPDAPSPIRVEFFGDNVDSIREFDPDTQLSTGQLKSASVAPMREFAASAADLREWADAAKDSFADERFSRSLKDRTELADEGESFAGWEFLLPLMHPLKGTVLDYFPENAVFIIDEPTVVEDSIKSGLDTA